jgi:hypothetical protein
MNRFAKVVSVLSASAALVLGLSGCGSDSKARDASIEELTNRNFKDVKFMKDVGPFGETMLFTGQAGTCRLEISRNDRGVYKYWTLPGVTEETQKALDEKAGGKLVETVNASYIEMYGVELGLGYCVPVVAK